MRFVFTLWQRFTVFSPPPTEVDGGGARRVARRPDAAPPGGAAGRVDADGDARRHGAARRDHLGDPEHAGIRRRVRQHGGWEKPFVDAFRKFIYSSE